MQNQTDPTAAETSADNPAVSDESAVAGDERLNAALAELQQLREQSLRERAELENQRRRMQRDVDSARRFANERLLGDLLPVIDSLKAGLGADVADTARLREGMELTLRQLLKMASDHGLQTVHPVGLPFNPEQHQAMSLLPSPEHAPGTVVQVYQDGYVLNDRLLRPALVVVAAD
ncbi:MAG: nucleotide exchange factor GrpE [Lysobacterales bacterium CG17_big_fil_post_rev_8_21_14_2_50_64_11]|nr:MAG: nucleotide exchange factor GrpE [Xanthomonadales bacterium CG17_big_fil_post_rev_8_21_14_2_50_64_11]